MLEEEPFEKERQEPRIFFEQFRRIFFEQFRRKEEEEPKSKKLSGVRIYSLLLLLLLFWLGEQTQIEREVLVLNHEDRIRILTHFSNEKGELVHKKWVELGRHLVTKYRKNIWE